MTKENILTSYRNGEVYEEIFDREINISTYTDSTGLVATKWYEGKNVIIYEDNRDRYIAFLYDNNNRIIRRQFITGEKELFCYHDNDIYSIIISNELIILKNGIEITDISELKEICDKLSKVSSPFGNRKFTLNPNRRYVDFYREMLSRGIISKIEVSMIFGIDANSYIMNKLFKREVRSKITLSDELYYKLKNDLIHRNQVCKLLDISEYTYYGIIKDYETSHNISDSIIREKRIKTKDSSSYSNYYSSRVFVTILKYLTKDILTTFRVPRIFNNITKDYIFRKYYKNIERVEMEINTDNRLCKVNNTTSNSIVTTVDHKHDFTAPIIDNDVVPVTTKKSIYLIDTLSLLSEDQCILLIINNSSKLKTKVKYLKDFISTEVLYKKVIFIGINDDHTLRIEVSK